MEMEMEMDGKREGNDIFVTDLTSDTEASSVFLLFLVGRNKTKIPKGTRMQIPMLGT